MSRTGTSDFDAFASASMPRLRRLAYAWCRDQHRADDLVQAALERVFAAWPRVLRAEDPFAYTRTTMVRLLISEQRRPRFRREVTSDDLPEHPAGEVDVAGRLDLIALVHRLPRRQRLVVLLRFVEDLPVAEVASLMACSEGTVKSQTQSPPLIFGAAPPGTRIVELVAAGRETVRAPARDAGADYDHRAYYIAEWPLLVETIARALSDRGDVLATVVFGRPDAGAAERQCVSARSVVLSQLQSAAGHGRAYAKSHPETDDPQRLAQPRPQPGGRPGAESLPEEQVRQRYERALQALGVMGPAETYYYRLGANVVTGDGAACYDDSTKAVAQRYLDQSKGVAPLPSRFGK